MLCVVLHKICISENDPSQPRWKLQVNELDCIRDFFLREENMKQSNLNRIKTSNW